MQIDCNVTATYFTKAINGSCVHVDGGYPSFCIFPAYGYSIRSCITNCTNKASCVGFMYNYVDAICAIIPTDGTCPSGFNFILHSNTAETVNDLVAYPLPGTFCYGKHSDWYPISNGYYVAQEEGNYLDDPVFDMTLTDCQRKCDVNILCHSIAWCPKHNDRCYVMDKKLTKTTPTRYHGYCTSYYKDSRGSTPSTTSSTVSSTNTTTTTTTTTSSMTTTSKEECCNPDFVDIDGDNCEKYKVSEWCSSSGALGPRWDESYGTFQDFAVNGQTAAVCPQCGCGDPLQNRGCYRINTTSVTDQSYTGYYEREEFPIIGIGLRQCECHCQNKYSCERADFHWTSETIGNCFIYISGPTNTSFECRNCKLNEQFIIKC